MKSREVLNLFSIQHFFRHSILIYLPKNATGRDFPPWQSRPVKSRS
jgi:hypothetical protein